MDSIAAIQFAEKAIKINKSEKNTTGYLIAMNQLGRVFHHFRNFNKAKNVYLEALEFYDTQTTKPTYSIIGTIYSNLSNTYGQLGEKEKSIEMVLKGLDIAKLKQNETQISYSLYLLGYKYMDLENYKKAEEYFLKSLSYSDSISLETYINANHQGLGINYSRWGKYDKALFHNKIALNNFIKRGDKLYTFDALNNTAVVYERLKKPDSVIYFANKALDIALDLNQKFAINGAKTTLSNGYLDKGAFLKAERLLLDIAKDTIDTKIINANDRGRIFENLSKAYEGQKKYKKSLFYHKKYKTLSDSILSEQKDERFAEIETKYQTQVKEKENLELRTETAEKEVVISQKSTRIWQLIAVLLFLAAVITYFIYKYIAEKKRLIIENQKYQREVKKVKNLQELLNSESLKDEENTKIKTANFHDYLINKYKLTNKTLAYWIEQSKGIPEKEMAAQEHVSTTAIESRRKRLYEKIKAVENIDYATWLTKDESVRIYRKNWQNFEQ